MPQGRLDTGSLCLASGPSKCSSSEAGSQGGCSSEEHVVTFASSKCEHLAGRLQYWVQSGAYLVTVE